MAYTKLLCFRHIIISYGNPIIKISCNSFSKNKEIYCCSMPGEVIIDLLRLTVFKPYALNYINSGRTPILQDCLRADLSLAIKTF